MSKLTCLPSFLPQHEQVGRQLGNALGLAPNHNDYSNQEAWQMLCQTHAPKGLEKHEDPDATALCLVPRIPSSNGESLTLPDMTVK